MQRTNIIELKPSKKQRKVFKELCFLSSCVYNITNYQVRRQIINKQPVFGFFQLQQKVQKEPDYQRLGRVYSLPRIQVYSETNSARFKLIQSKSQKRVGLPKYLKNRKTNTTIPSFLVIDNCQYHIGAKKATIPLSRILRKEYGIKHFDIPYNGVLRWQGKQARGQIHYKDGKYYLHQSVEMQEPKKKTTKILAGIDLGIKKLFAVKIGTEEDILTGNEYIVGGSRRHFKQFNHYNTLIAKEQEHLATINRKTSKHLSRLYTKRGKWQNNLTDNLVAKVFRIMNRENVSRFFVGDVANIREGNSIGSTGNMMLHNYWAFDKTYHKLSNKAEEHGIEMIKQSEEYTSCTCPICGDTDASYKKDRLFLCDSCGHFGHRDIIGAINIMINGMHSQEIKYASGRDIPFSGGQSASS